MLPQIRSAEANLTDTLKQTAAALDGVGAGLPAALADLQRAAADAKARMQSAADAARACLSSLLADVQTIVAQLSAGLATTAAPLPAPAVEHQQQEAPSVDPAPAVLVPSVQTLAPVVQSSAETVAVAANGPIEPNALPFPAPEWKGGSEGEEVKPRKAISSKKGRRG